MPSAKTTFSAGLVCGITSAGTEDFHVTFEGVTSALPFLKVARSRMAVLFRMVDVPLGSTMCVVSTPLFLVLLLPPHATAKAANTTMDFDCMRIDSPNFHGRPTRR